LVEARIPLVRERHPALAVQAKASLSRSGEKSGDAGIERRANDLG